ncbi:hypothetical protein ABT093_39200 [Kitasatospora sp. NPDC002551]|uniref:caspase, EACC1-associated type n=1 Tax=Kitasatospora sp. NPDC002551 TaxID=3154539 RepID=UPI00331C3C23
MSGGAQPGLGALPGAHAILVGTGRHRPGSTLEPLLAVDATLADLKTALQDVCGLPAERIHSVPAEADQTEVLATVERVVAEASGAVALYYVGHGLLGPNDELYLATWHVRTEHEIAHAVAYRTVRDLLGRARGGSIVVLDCCYSGRAAAPFGGPDRDPFARLWPVGSFLLTSAHNFTQSFAPPGAKHTRFSGRLLKVLTEGDPEGLPELTMDGLHAVLARQAEHEPVRPRAHSEGDMGTLAIAPNRAYRPAPGDRREPPGNVPCPYPGMRPFRPKESRWFAGRADLVEHLLDAVCDRRTPGPTVLVGASGAGKSSLLRAGLLAGLADRHGRGAADVPWPALEVPSPGPAPMAALTRQWARLTGRTAEDVQEAFAQGRFPAPLPGHAPCGLLVVDQFEEVFTRCEDERQRDRFIDLLCRPDVPGRPETVLALRADAYGHALAHPDLAAALERNQLAVEPLKGTALREAVEQPALEAGLTLENGLVDRLLHDLRQGGGSHEPVEGLPFLAHALHETWQRRAGAVLTLAGYQDTRGIWHAVANTGDQLYERLDAPGRAALRDVLLRLVHLDADGGARRRGAALPALLEGRPPEERRALQDVIEALDRSRLITRSEHGAQISHEALLRGWPLLGRWIRESRADLLRHQEIAESAAAWVADGRRAESLLTGKRLERLLDLLEQPAEGPGLPLAPVEREFLDAGRAAERRRRRRHRRRRALAVTLALAVTAAGTVAVVSAARARGERDRRRAAVVASQRLADQAEALRSENPGEALDLSLAAYRAAPTAEARGALLASALQPVQAHLTGHSAFVTGLAFNRSGRTLASAAADGSVRIWNTADRYHPSAGEVLEARGNAALAWHPDGNHLLVHTPTDLSVWDLEDPSRPRLVSRTAADAGPVTSLSPSADGTVLAASTSGGKLWLWDLRDLSRPGAVSPALAPGGPEPGSEPARVYSVSFHPDGRTLALAVAGGRVRILDVSDRGLPHTVTELGTGASVSVAFSPDGRRLVGAAAGGGLHLWDTSDPARPAALPDPAAGQEASASLSFPAQEPLLATVDQKGRLALTRIDEPLAARREVPGGAGLRAAAYAPDGRTVAAGDESGTVTLWNPPVQSLPELLTGSLDQGEPVLSADGRYGVGRSGTIWRLGPQGPPAPVGTVPGATGEVRFLQGRDVLIGMAGPGLLRLWSFSDGTARPAGEIPVPGPLAGRPVVGASPGSTVIAVYNGTPPAVHLWDIQQVHHPVQLGTVADQYPNADTRLTLFGANGHRLAVRHFTQFRILDITEPAKARQLALVRGQPQSLSTSGDDWLIVSREVIADEAPHQPNTAWVPGPDGEATRLATGPRLGDTAHYVRAGTVAALSDLGQPFLADLGSPGKRYALPGGLSRVTSLAVGPASGLLAAWGSTEPAGAPLALWRLPAAGAPTGGAELLAQTRLDRSGLTVQGFRPGDGALLLGLSRSPLALLGAESVLVPADFDRLHRELCGVRTVRYARAEWENTFSDLPYADPCG